MLLFEEHHIDSQLSGLYFSIVWTTTRQVDINKLLPADFNATITLPSPPPLPPATSR